MVNYIHLNPARAGMVPLQELRQYAASSYPKFFDAKPRPPLVRERFLSALEFPDTANGMTRYAEHLELAEEADAERHDELSRRYCRGWAVASEEYRQDLKKRFAGLAEPAGWGGAEVAEMREEKWRRMLDSLIRAAGKTLKDARAEAKSAPWKVKIARELRAGTTASNAWIAGQLSMGHPSRVSNLVHSKD